MIKEIIYKKKLLALIVKSSFKKDGIEFFTPNDFSQQVGYMKRPSGYEIMPHSHNEVPRNVSFTQEVLFIKSGKVRVDFYDDFHNYLESCILLKGDIVLLAFGGHGFQMLEDSEIIEVKQGPYVGENDKIRFNSVNNELIKLK